MGVTLALVAALLVLPVLLLAVPVSIAFRFERIGAFSGRIAVRWLFGLARFRFRLPAEPSAKREREARKPRKKKAPRQRSQRRGGSRNVLAVIRQAPFRRRVYRLLRDLLDCAHVHELALRARLGLGDPADTGRLWAVLGPLGALAAGLRNAQVRIEPEFIEPVLEFEAEGRMRLIPLQLIAVAVAFALSPPSIRAWWTLGSGDG
ncbi:MAG: DUF2953 domain-containing protein [Burkholderiales bacterium]|nr:MAG: DUF2953 domain-containing protein [Burkholderiales bacterium]